MEIENPDVELYVVVNVEPLFVGRKRQAVGLRQLLRQQPHGPVREIRYAHLISGANVSFVDRLDEKPRTERRKTRQIGTPRNWQRGFNSNVTLK